MFKKLACLLVVCCLVLMWPCTALASETVGETGSDSNSIDWDWMDEQLYMYLDSLWSTRTMALEGYSTCYVIAQFGDGDAVNLGEYYPMRMYTCDSPTGIARIVVSYTYDTNPFSAGWYDVSYCISHVRAFPPNSGESIVPDRAYFQISGLGAEKVSLSINNVLDQTYGYSTATGVCHAPNASTIINLGFEFDSLPYSLEFRVADADISEGSSPAEDNSSWFQRIIDGILSLPSNIASSVKGFFDNVVSAVIGIGDLIKNAIVELGNFLIDGLKSLFIPEDGYFEDLFSRIEDYFEPRLGFLWYPFAFFGDVISALSADYGSAALNIPALSINVGGVDYQYFNGYSYDFGVNEFSNIWTYVRFATSIVLACMAINMVVSKWDEWIGGHGNDS